MHISGNELASGHSPRSNGSILDECCYAPHSRARSYPQSKTVQGIDTSSATYPRSGSFVDVAACIEQDLISIRNRNVTSSSGDLGKALPLRSSCNSEVGLTDMPEDLLFEILRRVEPTSVALVNLMFVSKHFLTNSNTVKAYALSSALHKIFKIKKDGGFPTLAYMNDILNYSERLDHQQCAMVLSALSEARALRNPMFLETVMEKARLRIHEFPVREASYLVYSHIGVLEAMRPSAHLQCINELLALMDERPLYMQGKLLASLTATTKRFTSDDVKPIYDAIMRHAGKIQDDQLDIAHHEISLLSNLLPIEYQEKAYEDGLNLLARLISCKHNINLNISFSQLLSRVPFQKPESRANCIIDALELLRQAPKQANITESIVNAYEQCGNIDDELQQYEALNRVSDFLSSLDHPSATDILYVSDSE